MSNKIFTPLGASNHAKQEREKHDFYATSPEAVRKLFAGNADFIMPEVIYEPACGTGCLSEVLKNEYERNVYSYDIMDRGYSDGGVKDFFQTTELPEDCNCILTNPPYSLAAEFILHSLRLLQDGGLCIMFLKTTFLEGKNRYSKIFSTTPPIFIYQFISRILCAKNADFEKAGKDGSAVSYAWFVFKKGYKGDTTVKWI